MAKQSETEEKIEEIRNNPYESGRILCAQQDICPFYYPWAGNEFTGYTDDGCTKKRVRCEYLSDLRGLDITIANRRRTIWGCGNIFNLPRSGGYKKVEVIVLEKR